MEFPITSAEMLTYLCPKYMQLSTPCFVYCFIPAQPVPHIYPFISLLEKFCLWVTSWYYQAPGRTMTRQPGTPMKWLLYSLPSMVDFYCHVTGCRVQLLWMDEREGTRLAGIALGGVIKSTWSWDSGAYKPLVSIWVPLALRDLCEPVMVRRLLHLR